MGQVNTIAGFLHEPSYVGWPADASIRATNEAAISRLPREDAWPPLSRDAFFFPLDDAPPGLAYRGRAIAIAWSSNQLLDSFEAWRAKFERLLREMYWDRAVLTVTTEWWGDYVISWTAEGPADEPSPVSEWTLEAWRLDPPARIDPPRLGFDAFP